MPYLLLSTHSNPTPSNFLYIWMGLSSFALESSGWAAYMETHPSSLSSPSSCIHRNMKRSGLCNLDSNTVSSMFSEATPNSNDFAFRSGSGRIHWRCHQESLWQRVFSPWIETMTWPDSLKVLKCLLRRFNYKPPKITLGIYLEKVGTKATPTFRFGFVMEMRPSSRRSSSSIHRSVGYFPDV